MSCSSHLSLVVLLLFAGAVGPAVSQDEPERSDDQPMFLEAHPVTGPRSPAPSPLRLQDRSDYRIGRQDLLEVSVFGVDELDQTVRVANDGSITMPLLGRIVVAGLTKTDLERHLARLLEEGYIRDPQVTVFVKEYESKRVAVSGSVKNPGSFEMLGEKTLLEMLSLAGGLDQDPGKDIIIFRQSEDGAIRRTISIELQALVYEADASLNLVVQPGDIIYVPAIEMIRIFVTGAVKNPDLYEIPRNEPVTVLKAITLAGGTTDRASQKRVQVMRTDPDGQKITLEVNLRKIKRGKAEDPILHKDDIVLVPEAFF